MWQEYRMIVLLSSVSWLPSECFFSWTTSFLEQQLGSKIKDGIILSGSVSIPRHVGQLQQLKNDEPFQFQDRNNNFTNYQAWISYVTSENLVLNQFVDIYFFLYYPHLYVWQCIEIVSRNKLFVTSKSGRVNVNFGVLEKLVWSLESPAKLFHELCIINHSLSIDNGEIIYKAHCLF